MTEAHEANETLRRQLHVLRDRHAAAQSQLALLTAQQSAAQAQREALTALTIPADRSGAWARFERFGRQIELTSAQSLAQLELDGHDQWSLETQFDDRANQRAIDVELARLKTEQKPPAA